MKRTIKTAIIQQSASPEAAVNRANIAAKVRQLAADGAQLIVNQELHDSLYFCQTENVDLCSLAVAIPGCIFPTILPTTKSFISLQAI